MKFKVGDYVELVDGIKGTIINVFGEGSIYTIETSIGKERVVIIDVVEDEILYKIK